MAVKQSGKEITDRTHKAGGSIVQACVRHTAYIQNNSAVANPDSLNTAPPYSRLCDTTGRLVYRPRV
jgi:hypothetical protein